MSYLVRLLVRALRYVSGLLYGPLWLRGSEWCDERIHGMERWLAARDESEAKG